MGMRISLCMIVRDEERDLPRCLESVRGAVDEIVVVDTGSVDRTPEIARDAGARVVRFPWTGSFAEARNVSIAHASGDWILWLDADEELCRDDIPALLEAASREDAEAYLLHVLNYVGEAPDEASALAGLSPRLFRRRPGRAFSGAIHEQILGSILETSPPGTRVEAIPVRIYHYGYLEDRVRSRSKGGRNLLILMDELKRRPDDPFVRFNLAMEHIRRGDYKKAAREFREAYLLRPDPSAAYAPHLLKNLCICLRELGETEDALRVASDTLAVLPDYTDMEFLRGLIHLDAGDYPSAVLSFLRCVEMGDAPTWYVSQRGLGSHHAWAMLGDIFTALEDKEKAVQAYTKALQAHPRHVPALRGLAGLMLEAERPKEVIRFISRVADLSDDGICVALADALCSAGHPRDALEFLEGVRPSEPALAARGKALMLAGRYAGAEEAFSGIPRTGRNLTPALVNSALCAFLRRDRGQVEECARHLEGAGQVEAAWACRALARLLAGEDPGDPAGDRNRCVRAALEVLGVLLDLREFEAFELALGLLKPLLPEPFRHLELGKLYMSHGFPEVALEELIKAHEAGAMDAEGYRILGKLAGGRELWEDAAVFYCKALEVDGQHLPTYTALVQTLTRTGRYKEALEVLEQGRRVFPHARILEDAQKALMAVVGSADRA